MKSAPIQLLQVMFKKVKIEWDEQHSPPEPPNPLTTIFVFDNVDISTEFSIGCMDPDHERGRMYLVNLRVVVDNKPENDKRPLKFSPYLIDVDARGVVVVPNGAEKLAPPDDLAAVNGASLLWSALREQVLGVTSRMLAGPVMLPTVHFHDLKHRTDTTEEAALPATHLKSRKTKGSRKSV